MIHDEFISPDALPDELVAWHDIFLIRWHICLDDDFQMR